jgi:2-alkyl-3-oxoalkanoate reductase
MGRASPRRPRRGSTVKVLVTGATGLLGRGVATHLAGRSDEVTVLQRGASGLEVSELRGDVCDPDVVARACGGQDAVIHLAAKVSVTGPWAEFERINVEGTRLLLDAAREAGVTRFVFVSSPSVAHSGSSLVGESATPADPDGARGNYSRSKAIAEQAALAANADGFSVVAIRPHLVWGPGDTQLVGRIVERARAGRLVLIDHGTALIDTTYVDNAVTALVAALDRAPWASGQALVVTNGEPRTVAELLTRICRAYGVPEPSRSVPGFVARNAGGIVERVWNLRRTEADPPMTRFLAEQLSTAHWFDQRHTREALQWKPTVSLNEGFELLRTAVSSQQH